MLTDRRFFGGVGGREAGEEGGEGFVSQGFSDGLELRGGDGEGVSVGELVEARDYSVLEIGLWSVLCRHFAWLTFTGSPVEEVA